jgi:phi13 family phage major tail protein
MDPAKSVVGVERLVAFQVEKDDDTSITYKPTPHEFVNKLKAAGYTPAVITANNSADNKIIESAAKKNGGALAIELADMSADDEVFMFGSTKMTGGTVASNTDDVFPYVCVKFMHTFNDGTVDLYAFPKAKFTPQGKSASTITDGGITYQSTQMQGTYLPTMADGNEMYVRKYVNLKEEQAFIEQWFSDPSFVDGAATTTITTTTGASAPLTEKTSIEEHGEDAAAEAFDYSELQ